MSKTLYHYDPKTGLLVSSSTAQVDVKASVNKEVYIIPPFSTFQVPPVVEESARVAKFNTITNSWTVVDDFRGYEVVNKETKEIVIWTEIGPIPEQYTFDIYERELKPYIVYSDTGWVLSDTGRADLIDAIWKLRKCNREIECSSDIEYKGHLIHVDAVSFNDIMLAAQEAILSGDMTTSKRWVTADNLDVQLNGNDFVAIAKLYGARRQKLVYESNEAWKADTEASDEELIEIFRDLKRGE